MLVDVRTMKADEEYKEEFEKLIAWYWDEMDRAYERMIRKEIEIGGGEKDEEERRKLLEDYDRELEKICEEYTRRKEEIDEEYIMRLLKNTRV